MNGGDPQRLTLRGFIDVGFAILVDEYTRLGVNLLEAIEKLNRFGQPESQPEPEVQAERNAESMQALMSMMAGVKGAPV